MAEEKMMNEVIETETNEEFDCEYSEESGGGFGKVVGGLVGSAVLAVGTAVIVKNRDRISDFRLKRKIKKLEAKGYTIVEPEEVEVEVVEEKDRTGSKKRSEIKKKE